MPQIQFPQEIFPGGNNSMTNAIGIALKSTFIPYKCGMPSISCQDSPLAYSQFAKLCLLAFSIKETVSITLLRLLATRGKVKPYGEHWIAARTSALLVPSVIVPDEYS